ncbi:MAG: DUF2062 domain-containing protein [Gomphosphaeria aponina SAG 52.96 = DSM 107014]|uniref:DUF2062 domain-containing protein n=1 Tax=Gomphosphaeria aponina SAG 52.96 = DSM 107014 TaxID=1521640 RepID=A0A941GUY9_9CHRO|nr:DUF2062 domain-containing protein [Gomphosphaeria aponina SAG 52.96 = DSM 107014]
MSKDFPTNKNYPKSVNLPKNRVSRELHWWLRRIRYFYIRFLRLQGKPQKIALGLAIGVFLNFFPVFGVQMIFAVIFASLLKANKFAAAAGTWVSNPITDVPLFLFNFQVGRLLLPWFDLSVDQLYLLSYPELMESGLAFIFTLFFGGLVVGSVASISTYFLSLYLITRWRNSSKGGKPFRR